MPEEGDIIVLQGTLLILNVESDWKTCNILPIPDNIAIMVFADGEGHCPALL